jgi:hypothetical protein
MLRSRHGSNSSCVYVRFGTSVAGAIASIHRLIPNAVAMAPAASADCIQLGRVDPLFKMKNRSFRIVNRTEAEDEGCPSNTTAHEQNSPTYHKNIVFALHPSSCKQTIIIHISTHCFYVFYSR